MKTQKNTESLLHFYKTLLFLEGREGDGSGYYDGERGVRVWRSQTLPETGGAVMHRRGIVQDPAGFTEQGGREERLTFFEIVRGFGPELHEERFRFLRTGVFF